MDDVRLPNVGENKPKNPLPRGVYMIRIGNSIVFVRRRIGRMFPLSQSEQEKLGKDLGLIDGC